MDAHGAELMLQIRAIAHQLTRLDVSLGDLSHVHTAGVEAVIVIDHIECAIVLNHIGIADTGTCIQQQRMGPGLAAVLRQEGSQIISSAKVLMVDH